MSLPVCKFYSSNRNCKFGKNCRYLHSIRQKPPPLLDTDDYNGEAVNNHHLNPILSSSETPLEAPDQGNKYDIQVSVNPASATDHQSSSFPLNKYTGQDDNSRINRQPSFNSEPLKICHYFAKHGKCAFGRNCRFEHSISDSHSSSYKQDSHHVREVPPRFQNSKAFAKSETSTTDDIIIQSPLEDSPSVHDEGNQCGGVVKDTGYPNNGSGGKRPSGRFCSYFRSGYCRNGRHCKFSHAILRPHREETKSHASPQIGEGKMERKQDKPRAYIKPLPQSKSRAYRPPGIQQIFKLSELESDGVEKFRQLDINFVEKRFHVESSLNETSDEFNCDVTFSPSDPDWPYDVRSYALQLILPRNYPKEVMIVKVPAAKQDLPESVRRYLEISFGEWLSERQAIHFQEQKVELMVRPFFKWLDKNFEDLMTEALKQLKRELTAKAAGMEFISADNLRAKYNAAACRDNDVYDSGDESANYQSEDDDDDDNSDECLESDDEEAPSSEDDKENSPLSLDAERKGTEIKLRNLQLKQNASSIMFEKLRMILQCSRCKNHSEVTATRGKIIALSCDKCNHEMLIQYRPTLAHQFSSVIGYLDLENCRAFDLIFQDSTIVLSCLSCSKLTKIDGMVSGQLIDGWCRACNARFKFATESVKFYPLEPSSVDQGSKDHTIEVVRPKSKKPPKDPAIREGQPLPDFGTCKHYKQSYRWLRFPCCGKAYPCDICHDKKEDHEMVMANRMICGHCCKEQNYSGSRPCNSCNQHMTKVHSSHWEGGTGCRDKIAMSKSDQQKYKNMHKTVSNHKKKVQSGSQKKTTKLRHA